MTTTAEGFEYVYEFENLGDGVTAVWNSAKWDGFVAALSRQEREFPVKLRASKELLKVPVLSPRRPLFQRDELIVLSDDGREAFRMSTPAYIPK